MNKNGSKFRSQKNLTSGLIINVEKQSEIRRSELVDQNALHTPVELEILKEFVLEEECRVVAAWDVKPSDQLQRTA